MSIQVNLSKSDLLVISRKRKTEKSGKLLKRYQCLWMLHEQYLKKDIASTLGVNIDTITDWIKIYNLNGLSGLGLLHYEGRRPSTLDKIKDKIEQIILQENISRIKDLQTKLIEEFQLEVEHSWLYRYCKKNSIYLIKNQD